MKTIEETIQQNIMWLNKKIQKQLKLQPMFEKALDIAKTSPMFANFMVLDWLDCQLMLEFEVQSFSQATSILAQLESALGTEFIETNDSHDIGCRLIYNKERTIRIDLRPAESSPLCRQEIIGYEQKPVYKFICDGMEEQYES